MAGKVFSRLSMKDEEKKCVLLAGPLGLHQEAVLQTPTLALVVENFSCENSLQIFPQGSNAAIDSNPLAIRRAHRRRFDKTEPNACPDRSRSRLSAWMCNLHDRA